MLEKIPQSVGASLQNQRAGMENTVFHRLGRPAIPQIDVRSGAFAPGATIPVQYTADGIGFSPPLAWIGMPLNTASIAMIVEDADSPTPHPLVHAIVVNMGVDDAQLEEGALNSPDHQGVGLQVGRNSFLTQAWLPPDPPPGHGIHRYVFQVFALHSGTAFSQVPGRHELFDAVKARAIAGGYLIGTYSREQKVSVRDNQREAEIPETEQLPEAVAVGVPA
jgi:Raf kinase inhibitor-like YbhB/YbcL family protein